MERLQDHPWAAPHSGVCRTERLLMRVPIAFFTAAGLVLGLSRFVSVLQADLQTTPSSVVAVLFLVVILLGVALLIVLFSAAIGFLVGMLLEVGYGLVKGRGVLRPVL